MKINYIKEMEAIKYVKKATPILEKMVEDKEIITEDYCRKLAEKIIRGTKLGKVDERMIEYVSDTLIGSYAV